jgi:hypothetical protein
MTLWDANPPATNAAGQELSPAEMAAERILKFFFKDDKISNKLGVVRVSLDSSRINKRLRSDSVILGALNACDDVVKRFDNARLERLQDDAELKEYMEYMLAHPSVNQGRITEEGVLAMDDLGPERLRSMVQRYIDELKPVIAGLKEDLGRLMQVSPGDIPAASQAQALQTSI